MPIQQRIMLFKQEFKEFHLLKHDQCVKLISEYDRKLSQVHEMSSIEFAIIGSLFLYVGWLMLSASSVFQLRFKDGLSNEYFS